MARTRKHVEVIREIAPHKVLVRDRKTGIARVEDHTAGVAHGPHPNIQNHAGYKKVYGENARVARAFGFTYNLDGMILTTEEDKIAAEACECEGCRERRRAKVG